MIFEKHISKTDEISPAKVAELEENQRQVAQSVVLQNGFRGQLRFVVGIDLAFRDNYAVTAGVVMTFPDMQKVTSRVATHKLIFPYISGFLVFREGPPILEMIQSLPYYPKLVFVNAHGIAHPRFCGCASHVGVLSGIPTIGVALRILCGYYDSEAISDSKSYAPLLFQNKQVGWVLRSRPKNKPIVISPGHLIDIVSCLNLTKTCIRSHKLPVPLQLAHELSVRERNSH